MWKPIVFGNDPIQDGRPAAILNAKIAIFTCVVDERRSISRSTPSVFVHPHESIVMLLFVSTNDAYVTFGLRD